MTKTVVLVFLICIFIGEISTSNGFSDNYESTNITNRNGRCETNFDILIQELLAQSWNDDERPCLEQILKIIHNVKNSTLWATWLWDSMQLPVGQLYGSRYHLGNYDQCLKETVAGSHIHLRTQYCLADVTFQRDERTEDPGKIDFNKSTERYIHTVTKFKQRFNIMSWGVCTPHTCQLKSVKKFLKALLKQSHLGYLRSPIEITIDSCEVSGDSKHDTDGLHILIYALLVPTIIVLISTYYISEQRKVKSDRCFVTEVIECFCLKRNIKDFMSLQNDDIKTVHGIRVLVSCFVILVHSIFYFLVTTTGNGWDFEEALTSRENFLSLTITVDTFFIMSGLVFIRSIKNKYTFMSLVNQIIRRYFRLMWWYVGILLTVLFILPRTGCGPLCSKFMKTERGACLNSWWLGILMVANYIDKPNICIAPAWYIFCDFQLTIVAALVFWLLKRQHRAGLICYTILVILSVLLPGLATYNSGELLETALNFDVYKITRSVNSNSIYMALYVHAHYRASPHLMGMMIGYIMIKYNPNNLRKAVTKKQSLILVLAFFTITAVFLLLCSHLNVYILNAVFVAMHRVIYAAMVCIFIIICEYGRFSSITDFLSWPIFARLAKLTYGAYMVHSITILYNLFSARSPLYINRYIVVEKFLGNMTLAFFISFFILLFVEAPLNNLVKLLLANSCFRDITKEKLKDEIFDELHQNKAKDVSTQAPLVEYKDKQI